MDMWELLRQGRTEEAIQVTWDEYAKDATNPSLAIRLGVGYSWLRDWERAWKHFHDFIEVYPSTTDFAFKYAGTAKWCAGDRVAAVAEWKQGIDVDYADVGGGITIPLHLYFAAAVEPDIMPMHETVELLQSRLQAKPRDAWPAYLAKLLLGETTCESAIAQSESDVSHLWGDERRQAEEAARQQIGFWWGVKQLTLGNHAGFRAAMRNYADLAWDDFDTNRELLIAKLRSSEFYLARRESGRIVGDD
jgi:lipoprotein NlpI